MTRFVAIEGTHFSSETKQIDRFRDEHFFLSNMYPAMVDGFPSLEHAYVLAKIGYHHEPAIRSIDNPKKVKTYGKGFPVVEGWNTNKDTVMYRLVSKKFEHPELKPLLAQTGMAKLIEGNNWGDTYFGECPIGNGHNVLGNILMIVRYEIQHGNFIA